MTTIEKHFVTMCSGKTTCYEHLVPSGVERAKLKTFIILDAQGSVFDDTGTVEILSTRSIVSEGRE